MFPEFHGYIYDPQNRELDLMTLTAEIGGYKKFGSWENGKCTAGWNVMNNEMIRYKLSNKGLYIESITESQNGIKPHKMVWVKPPPQPSECIVM